ncbi:hypothetical protein G647_01288 [Cladophialophora carrionii CBS 160.54]|uniref:Uncharacterized protein n=1 Tax=Cladophialophora carrionii CBS 160.54 TaxID=1279043 RepID=V9DQA6_9EURO|nr:uncharacterized protein G647_01288 [Cladophialophora carrionii CBS 160.54]ETI28836.1 hypothetical protein G647_01288 [Cladophialophora carrionii CBS 160.54]
MAHKHLGERARSTEPQNCANHRTVQKSFLNQICEDCLLAELDAGTNPDRNVENAHETEVTVHGSGEGLIWDSEVKIEIEGHGLVSPTSPAVQNAPQPIIEPLDNRQIFESQVQITIQYEDHGETEEDLRSPTFTASPPVRSSRTSSVGISPAGARYTHSCQLRSPNYLSKRHGRDFRSKLSELDDADDEFERMERFSGNPRQTERGRALTRSNLRKVEKSEPEAEMPVESVSVRTAGWPGSRFHSLRSLSTTFVSVVRGDEAKTVQTSATYPTSSSSLSVPRIRNPFRTIRSRRSSPLMQESSSLFHASWKDSPVNHGLVSEAHNLQLMLPRKSTLKDLTLCLAKDLKRTKAVWPPSTGTPCELLQSPSSMGIYSDCDDQETAFSETQTSDSHSDTAFETDSRVTSLHSEATPAHYGDRETSGCCMIPSIPKPSTMNTLRAVIDDLGLGVDTQGACPSQGPIAPDVR